MQPEKFEVIGGFLAIRWSEGDESVISLERLRRACPCAACSGEVDVTGQLHKGPDPVLNKASFRVLKWGTIGNYAVQPSWADGHETGIYSYGMLRDLGKDEDDAGPA
jgi:DUF971 family protein